MPRVLSAAALVVACLALVTAACGNDDNAEPSLTPMSTSVAQIKTPGSADSSPAADETPGPRTPGTAATPAPSAAAGATKPTSANAPSSFEATLAADVGEDVLGGNPSDPREAVGDVPTPPPGATIDPTAVTEPQSEASGVQIIVDMDASTPGVQASRTVGVGDVLRVAIVVTNVPSDGMSSFNFFLDYDRTKIVAPSYAGGPSTDRNPDLYETALGDGWTCLPAPEGDLDDPGGINGDNLSGTGRALLSCFNVAGAPNGSLVVATIEFHAIATGASQLTLKSVALAGGASNLEFGHCDGDADTGPTVIPCVAGSITVQ